MSYDPIIERISHPILLRLTPYDTSLLIFFSSQTQGYIQSTAYTQRKVFIYPLFKLNLGPNKLLHVVKSSYALIEKKIYWFETYHRHHYENKKMRHAVRKMIFLFYEEYLFGNFKIPGVTYLQRGDILSLSTAASISLSIAVLFKRQDFYISQLTALHKYTLVYKSSFGSQRAFGA